MTIIPPRHETLLPPRVRILKLAKESNLGKSTVSRVVKLIGTTRPQKIQKISHALDIYIKDLIL